MKKWMLSISTSALLLVSSFVPALAGNLKFINFDVPGASVVDVTGISDDNTVTGYYEDHNFVVHGFVRSSGGAIVSFDPPNSSGTYTGAINASDEVIGYFYDASDTAHGYVREPDGTIAAFDFPKGDATYAFGINNKGEITGEFQDPAYGAFLRRRSGRFKKFGVRDAGNEGVIVNDSGAIAGRYCTASCWTSSGAFLRTSDGTITTFSVSGEQITLPFGLNKSGLIAGTALDSSFVREGFLREPDGQITTDSQCGFTAVNNKGWVVGTSTFDSFYHGCVRAPDGTETFFDDPNAGTGNLQGTHSAGINDTRYVAGDYQDSNGNFHGFLVHLPK